VLGGTVECGTVDGAVGGVVAGPVDGVRLGAVGPRGPLGDVLEGAVLEGAAVVGELDGTTGYSVGADPPKVPPSEVPD
jgi:hypothetical protein